jgi:hypothetical protein
MQRRWRGVPGISISFTYLRLLPPVTSLTCPWGQEWSSTKAFSDGRNIPEPGSCGSIVCARLAPA